MISIRHGYAPDSPVTEAWILHIDTPVGTIAISDANEKPDGPADYEKDEVLLRY